MISNRLKWCLEMSVLLCSISCLKWIIVSVGLWSLKFVSIFKLAIRLWTSEAIKKWDLLSPTFSYFFCSDLSNYCFSLLLGVLGIIPFFDNFLTCIWILLKKNLTIFLTILFDKFFWGIFLTNFFDEFFDEFFWRNFCQSFWQILYLLTIASFRVGVPSILFFLNFIIQNFIYLIFTEQCLRPKLY